MRSMHVTPDGSVCIGTWVCEGHSVTFKILDNNKVSITESFSPSSWTKVNRNWSMSEKVELDEAAREQDKYICLGYKKIN